MASAFNLFDSLLEILSYDDLPSRSTGKQKKSHLGVHSLKKAAFSRAGKTSLIWNWETHLSQLELKRGCGADPRRGQIRLELAKYPSFEGCGAGTGGWMLFLCDIGGFGPLFLVPRFVRNRVTAPVREALLGTGFCGLGLAKCLTLVYNLRGKTGEGGRAGPGLEWLDLNEANFVGDVARVRSKALNY